MNAPHVGIWWDDGKTIAVCSHPCTENVTRTRSLLDSNLTHVDQWPAVAKELGRSVTDEYFSVPRGRVLLDVKSMTSIILHGNATTRSRLELIARRFQLRTWKSEMDHHYLTGAEADRLFEEDD